MKKIAQWRALESLSPMYSITGESGEWLFWTNTQGRVMADSPFGLLDCTDIDELIGAAFSAQCNDVARAMHQIWESTK